MHLGEKTAKYLLYGRLRTIILKISRVLWSTIFLFQINSTFCYAYPFIWIQQQLPDPSLTPLNSYFPLCNSASSQPVKQEEAQTPLTRSKSQVTGKQKAQRGVEQLDEGGGVPKWERREQVQEYRPNQKSRRGGKGKIYEKDENRNIMPNTINKLFSFLRSKTKSQQFLVLALEKHPALRSHCSPAKFYTYHAYLKSTMNKFIVQDNINRLFQIVDPTAAIFTLQEQIVFLRLNAIILLYYIKNPSFFISLIHSSRVSKEKIKQYLSTIRRIQDRVEQLAASLHTLYP